MTTPNRFSILIVGILLLFTVTTVTSFYSPIFSNRRHRTLPLVNSIPLHAENNNNNVIQQDTNTPYQRLEESQLDFCRGYLNKHHRDLLCLFAEAYSEVGAEQQSRNSFSGGSFKITDSQVINISMDKLDLEVTIYDRKERDPIKKRVSISLDSNVMIKKRQYITLLPVIHTTKHEVDSLVRNLNRLCHQVKRPDVTGKIIQMGIQFGSTLGAIKENLWLNQVPHNRFVRNYFYDMIADATLKAVVMCSNGEISNRMKITAMFPEMNPSMDSYRCVFYSTFSHLLMMDSPCLTATCVFPSIRTWTVLSSTTVLVHSLK
jgi:hypothetical protein